MVSANGAFSIATASERAALKQTKKRQRKAAAAARALGADDADADILAALGFDPGYLETERSLGLQKDRAEAPRGATDGVAEAALEWRDERRGLPPGTERFHGPGYEEVIVPPPSHSRLAAKTDEIELVVLDEALPSWARAAFPPHITKLNRLQSAVFESAFHTSENLLICAPTGAGKTNVAMLTLLQLVSTHVRDGVLDRAGVKAIYVAPMKALAQEVVATFGQRLAPLQLRVRELTGDMQLTRREAEEANLIVTTPEKWDVITRKAGAGEGGLATSARLIIIDEVHLLAEDRGAVIESLVARTQRLVESTQSFVRLVGLSATLPNYVDVALFLRVNPERGLFHFGPEWRPVPLKQTFIGVKEKNRLRQHSIMDEVTYERARDAVRAGHQVMVFVHARRDTVRTAMSLRDRAAKENNSGCFECADRDLHAKYAHLMEKSRNHEMRELFSSGLSIHNAGMLRPDRSLVEQAFAAGAVRVLFCTATLAWGVNLPAHTVICKGTDVYDPQKGGFVDLSMLDVMQIFGRAGRPQFDTSGDATLITSHAALPRYLAKLAHAAPMESSFIQRLGDHLNAEVAAGTVTSIREGAAWLSYTFLHVRMLKSPIAYGLKHEQKETDPLLEQARMKKIKEAAVQLDANRMLRYDPRSGNLAATELGRVASHFYLRHESIEAFNDKLKPALVPHIDDAGALSILCSATEFEELRVRPEELAELDRLKAIAPLKLIAPVEDPSGKAAVLLQAYISQHKCSAFTLISDCNYVAQNGARVARALFEIALRNGWPTLAERMLALTKAIDNRVWWFQTPLRQLDMRPPLPPDALRNLEEKKSTIEQILDMGA